MPMVRVATRLRCRGRKGYALALRPIVRISVAAKTDFVTNSRATRWMFRRIWRPSATIAGSDAKSPPTSTTSATLRAICAPLP